MCIFLNVVWNFTGEGLLTVLFETYPKFSGLLTHDNSISRWVIENLENRETFPCCLRRCTYLSTHQWPFALAKPYRYRRKCDTHNLKQQIQPTNEIFIMPSNNKKPCRPVQETYNLFISWKEICVYRRTSLNIPNLGHPTAMHLCQPPLVIKTNVSPFIPIFAKILFVMIGGRSVSQPIETFCRGVCGGLWFGRKLNLLLLSEMAV